VDDLEVPTKEHLRESHREGRLQSSPFDRAEAWGIVVALILAPIVYLNWSALPVAAAVAGVLAAALLGSSAIS
jgi:hypothetical protein